MLPTQSNNRRPIGLHPRGQRERQCNAIRPAVRGDDSPLPVVARDDAGVHAPDFPGAVGRPAASRYSRTMTAPEFDIPQPVLDALDDILDIEPLEPGWRDQPPDALIAAVARLDEALAAEADSLGIKGDMAVTMAKLVYELHRRKDQRRYSAARVAHEVMEAGIAHVAKHTAPLN